MRRPHYVYQEEAAGGEGEGGGGGGEGTPDVKESITNLTTQLGVVTKALGLMAQGQAETQASIRAMAESQTHKPAPREEKVVDQNAPLFEGLDLEQMDRSQFGTVLVSKFMERMEGLLDGKLKPVGDRITGLEGSFTKDLGSRNVNDVAKDNKDLYEWKEEIGALLQATPGLSLGRALVVARAENTAKASAMAKKYAGGGPDEKKVGYLSLTPTSRRGPPDEKKGRMKFNEAADRAFDDAVAAAGGTSFEQLTGSR